MAGVACAVEAAVESPSFLSRHVAGPVAAHGGTIADPCVAHIVCTCDLKVG